VRERVKCYSNPVANNVAKFHHHNPFLSGERMKYTNWYGQEPNYGELYLLHGFLAYFLLLLIFQRLIRELFKYN
jgi:hypothetical protein